MEEIIWKQHGRGAQLPWPVPHTSVCAVELAATLDPDSTRAGILQAQDSYRKHF